MKIEMERKNIVSRDEIKLLVNSFYERVKQDDLLAPVFANVYWPHHLPTMYNFWASVLLGEISYYGNPFSKHKDLEIKREHFERWLELFLETVNSEFSGPVADEAKNRAKTISSLFQHKMGLMKE
jgi:hemoglobin